MTEYGADMAASADPAARTAWPAEWLPPGAIAGRDATPPDMSEAACADDANWWWGPGRGGDEVARVWFRRGDDMWEELSIAKPSPVLVSLSQTTLVCARTRYR